MGEKWKYLFFATCAVLLSHTRAESTRALPDLHEGFESIRATNKVYVDKSDYIPALLESGSRFLCMCRPARFGKSNFLQMLESYFRGWKELFAGLAIHEKHDWQKSYPVIHLDFGSKDVSNVVNFSASLSNDIVRIGREYGVKIDENLPLYPIELQPLDKLPSNDESKLAQLMRHLTENWTKEQSVVILIDEYDYPKRQNSALFNRYFYWSDVDTAVETFLNPFFYELERVNRYVKFSFMTCTTKVLYLYRAKYPDSPITVTDITYDKRFNKMMGLTRAELQTHLKPHIDAMATNRLNETFHTLVQKLRDRYNGFCFTPANSTSDSDCRLFNFHSVISSLRGKNLNYLWHPGTYPKYNILNNVTTMTEGDEIFDVFSNRTPILTISRKTLENPFGTLPRNVNDPNAIPEKLSMRALLVLHGYLTFRGYNEQTDEFVVDFPNEEMRESFRRSILRFIAGKEVTSAEFSNTCRMLLKSLLIDPAETVVNVLNNELLQPNADNDDFHFYYRFSGNRIGHVLGACDGMLPGVMATKAFYHERINRDTNENNETKGAGFEYVQKFVCDVLVVRLPRGVTYTIKIDIERSAPCAINEVFKSVNTEDFRNASRNRTMHLMGINFNDERDLINDWIRMTYTNGKFQDIKASHPRYVKMYTAFANHVEPFAPFA